MPRSKELLWELSDVFWARIEPLLPQERPKTQPRGRGRGKGGRARRKVGGRPRVPARRVFAGILYILRTECQWEAVPRGYASDSTRLLWFQRWERAGVFRRLWQAGLAGYDELEGIAWRWQAVDGALTKAPLGRRGDRAESARPGKKGPSATSWWTRLASRPPWSSAGPTSMIPAAARRPRPRPGARHTSVWTRATTTLSPRPRSPRTGMWPTLHREGRRPRSVATPPGSAPAAGSSKPATPGSIAFASSWSGSRRRTAITSPCSNLRAPSSAGATQGF